MVATLQLTLHCRIKRLNPINTTVYSWTQSWPTSIHQPQSPPHPIPYNSSSCYILIPCYTFQLKVFKSIP